MKITVAGLGYVGLSNALLLARLHEVTAFDISADRVAKVNSGVSPVEDVDAQSLLEKGGLALMASTDAAEALAGSDLVIVATPTNYDPDSNAFDTTSVEAVIDLATLHAPHAMIVIRSTIPVGYVQALRARLGRHDILFVPEFLREGRALQDSLHPSRIVVGDRGRRGLIVSQLFKDASERMGVPVLLTDPAEAEAIKLFANTYLAMRVAFFNELDSFAMVHGLTTGQIIEGIGHDPRIGFGYNNPSFGYGGYCLPKDTRQLLANYDHVPQTLIEAIVTSNETRKQTITEAVLARSPKVVGVHRLVMKQGSDNFRDSSIRDIMARLAAAGIQIVIHEPLVQGDDFEGYPVDNDFSRFSERCDIILANRKTPELELLGEKLFSRDVFGNG